MFLVCILQFVMGYGFSIHCWLVCDLLGLVFQYSFGFSGYMVLGFYRVYPMALPFSGESL